MQEIIAFFDLFYASITCRRKSESSLCPPFMKAVDPRANETVACEIDFERILDGEMEFMPRPSDQDYLFFVESVHLLTNQTSDYVINSIDEYWEKIYGPIVIIDCLDFYQLVPTQNGTEVCEFDLDSFLRFLDENEMNSLPTPDEDY